MLYMLSNVVLTNQRFYISIFYRDEQLDSAKLKAAVQDLGNPMITLISLLNSPD